MYKLLMALALFCAGCGTPFQETGSGGAGGGNGTDTSSGPGGGDGGSTMTSSSDGGGTTSTGGSGSTGGAGSTGGSGGGCMTDTMTDPDNCGSCGHSCLGSGCTNGLCMPVQISNESPTSIATSSGAVVWGLSDGAGAANLDGSNVRSVPLGLSGPVGAVAGNGLHTFFQHDVSAHIYMFDAAAATLQVNHPAAGPVVLAADETAVYWADGHGQVGVHALDVTTLVVTDIATPPVTPNSLGVADGFVCWTSVTVPATGQGSIRCVNNAASQGSGSIVVPNVSGPRGIALGGGIYWAEWPQAGADSTHTAAYDGSGAGLLAAMSTAVATDAVDVYWVDHGVLRRRPRGGGPDDARAIAAAKVNYLAIGPDRAYFSSVGGIYWVAK